VVIALNARRFVCGNPACAVATFAEQVPGLTVCHQRRTPALRGLLESLALALAGRIPTGGEAGHHGIPFLADPAHPRSA
jgi:hypothetical protein